MQPTLAAAIVHTPTGTPLYMLSAEHADLQELCGEECRLVRVGYGTAEGEHVAGVGHSLLEGTSDGAHTIGGRGHALPCEEVRCCKFDAVF